ncbi:MAG: D-alanine--D-alanine ligase family protein [Coraliomargaritaceae bacterium]
MCDFRIRVFCGGIGPEREVSLQSGAAVVEALSARYDVLKDSLDAACLPPDLDPQRDIVFPALHGVFGEDGSLQVLLENEGVEFCGSGRESSRVCMDKGRTKEIAKNIGVAVPEGEIFAGDAVPLADDLMDRLGASLVLKPVDSGSSDGLSFTSHRSELGVALSQIHSGRWLAERRIRGRELTVGLLDGKALGVVEIMSESGVYDYAAKYTAGTTRYEYPAEIGSDLTDELQVDAERIFVACGCRDFARIDFLLEGDTPYFLEVNTLPGLTESSLLPKSAACRGYDFTALIEAMLQGARARKEAIG